MNFTELCNQKILDLISKNKCDLSNLLLQEIDRNIFNFTNSTFAHKKSLISYM